MQANNINEAATLPVRSPSLQKNSAEDLRNNFMTMLITQIKNQDPLKPMENAELTSQLAQINTVSGIDQLNDTLNGINTQIETGQALQATGLIGKGVMVSGDRVLVGADGASTPFGVELESPVQQLTATIVDAAGIAVRSFELGATDAGYETFVWDGTLESGEFAPQGAYKVMLQGSDAEGNFVESSVFNYALVQAITTDREGSPKLDLGGVSEQVSMKEVKQIL